MTKERQERPSATWYSVTGIGCRSGGVNFDGAGQGESDEQDGDIVRVNVHCERQTSGMAGRDTAREWVGRLR